MALRDFELRRIGLVGNQRLRVDDGEIARSGGKAFLQRLQERTDSRDTEIATWAYVSQLQALRAWGEKRPADLSVVKQPVLVANGDDDRMVPTSNSYDLAKRLPNAQLVIYPDAGHGGIFQYHEDFVPKALAFLSN